MWTSPEILRKASLWSKHLVRRQSGSHMKTIVLHLSDAHFSKDWNFAEDRIPALAAGVFSIEPDFADVIIVFSGDIGSTGAAEDYLIAKRYLATLATLLTERNPSVTIRIVSVPGNHDLDFSFIGDASETLARDVVTNNKSLADAEGTYRVLLNSQNNFHLFDSETTFAPKSSLREQIFKVANCSSGQFNIKLTMLNTAFLSRRHEVQGELWFPLADVEIADSTSLPSDLAVSIFHHPYAWLESNNSGKFRQYIEAVSDLVLTGHQHTPDSFYAASLRGGSTWYSAGAALQGKHHSESGFSVFVFDFEQQQRRLASFSWNGSLYTKSADTEWQSLTSNAAARTGYVISEQFYQVLDDPEGLVVHSQKRNILLRDIYEPPRMKASILKAGSATTVIQADGFAEFMEDKDSVFIFGEPLSGKTCLSKAIFRNVFQGDGSSVPLLLLGKNLKSSKEEDVEKWIRRAYRFQYAHPSLSEYAVLPRAKRTVIVDDWHALLLNEVGKKQVAKLLNDRFGTCVLMCDVWFQVQELASSMNDEAAVLPRNHLSILPLTPFQKTNMIHRWLGIGREDQTSSAEKVFQVDAAERYLDELSRQKLLPQFPLYILSALQTFQAMRQTEPDLGAQGVLFDVLVGSKLTSMSADAPEVDVNRQFISYIAGDIFIREATGITTERATELADEFFVNQAVRIEIEPLLRTLVAHKVIQVSDGYACFRQRYMYYYFVAEFFVANLSKRNLQQATKNKLLEMSEFPAFEEYAQILMFVIYKTKDPDLIDQLILNSKFIFMDASLCDLEHDIAFANHLEIKRPKMELPSRSLSEIRSDLRQELSRSEESDRKPEIIGKTPYSDDLEVGAKLQSAFKSMQMMGRVLRNFPGSLDAETKKQLAMASYEVGLRTLKTMMSGVEENLDLAREVMGHVIDEEGDVSLSPTDRMRDADELLTTLITLSSFVIIRSISTAVGSNRLGETYKQVGRELGHTVSTTLISLSIRLNHFKEIPVEVLLDLETKLSKNHIAYQILRIMVWQRLVYLPVEDRQLRQRICDKFGIRGSSAPILLANSKSQP